jgi:hypothetical protein
VNKTNRKNHEEEDYDDMVRRWVSHYLLFSRRAATGFKAACARVDSYTYSTSECKTFVSNLKI